MDSTIYYPGKSCHWDLEILFGVVGYSHSNLEQPLQEKLSTKEDQGTRDLKYLNLFYFLIKVDICITTEDVMTFSFTFIYLFI